VHYALVPLCYRLLLSRWKLNPDEDVFSSITLNHRIFLPIEDAQDWRLPHRKVVTALEEGASQ
jgi:hypothetical protein